MARGPDLRAAVRDQFINGSEGAWIRSVLHIGDPAIHEHIAYLSPDVLERLLLWREGPSATLLQMVEATYLPWAEQMGRVFDLTTRSSKVRP
jgi:hypothetical protein